MTTIDDATLAERPEHVPSEGRLRSGARVGRYRVLEPLGRGGMSEVYVAYDPRLDRSIALKIMKLERGHEAHARLQREGRALARLEHRNVVVVHDVGVFESELFVAMEHVKGEPLAQWMRAEARPVDALVGAFAQAAEALIAAHAAGVIHRDFKPSNAMVEATSGRVVVLDFGLARVRDQPTQGTSASQDLTASPVDATHSAVGTLGYMAPELMEGDGASEATDQFAFCVSLYEALYGQRPFVGRHAVELLEAITAGPAAPPKRDDVPGWLRDAVLRGLARDPAARHPSMRALADHLAPAPPRSGGRSPLLLATTVGALGLAGWAAFGPSDDPCSTADLDALQQVWNDARRVRARDAMVASARKHASDTADRALARVDRFALAWAETASTRCSREADSTATQTEAVQACLDRSLDRLEVAAATLERADTSPVIADRALDVALSLPPVRRCLDEVALPLGSPRAPAVSEAIARSVAARVTGSLEQARDASEQAVQASADALPRVRVDALLERSRVHDASAHYEDALTDAAAALSLATARELPRRQARASLEMVRLSGDRLRRFDEARRWQALATASVGRLAHDPVLEARQQWVLGTVRWRADDLDEAAVHLEAAIAGFEHAQLEPELAGALTELSMVVDKRGDHERARALLERTMDLRRGLYGPGHPALADTLADQAIVAGRSGDPHRALELGREALAIYEERVDPLHPHVATIVMNMGLELRTLGKHDEALRHFARAESIRRQHFGDEHVLVADVLNNKAPCLMALGRNDEARTSLLGTLAIVERAHGAESTEVLSVLTNLGNLDADEGNLDSALEHHSRAHDIALAKLGPNHPSVGIGAHNLGDLWVKRDRCDAARPHFERALAIFEGTLGPDVPEVAYPLTALGRCDTQAGRTAEAIRQLERALKVRTDKGIDPLDRGETAMALAQAHHAHDPGCAAARATADVAAQAFDAAGPPGRTGAREVRAWVATAWSEKPDSPATPVGSN